MRQVVQVTPGSTGEWTRAADEALAAGGMPGVPNQEEGRGEEPETMPSLSGEEQLLAAIERDPGDAVAVLALADWYEENGQGRKAVLVRDRDPVVADLLSDSEKARQRAYGELKEMAGAAAVAVPALQRALTDGDAAIRQRAIWILCEMGPAARLVSPTLREAQVDALKILLVDDRALDRYVRDIQVYLRVTGSCSENGSPGHEEPLPEEDVQQLVEQGLAGLGGQQLASLMLNPTALQRCYERILTDLPAAWSNELMAAGIRQMQEAGIDPHAMIRSVTG